MDQVLNPRNSWAMDTLDSMIFRWLPTSAWHWTCFLPFWRLGIQRWTQKKCSIGYRSWKLWTPWKSARAKAGSAIASSFFSWIQTVPKKPTGADATGTSSVQELLDFLTFSHVVLNLTAETAWVVLFSEAGRTPSAHSCSWRLSLDDGGGQG